MSQTVMMATNNGLNAERDLVEPIEIRQNLIQQLEKITFKKRVTFLKNEFLNRKMKQYFEKKKITRAFIEDDPAEVAHLEERYEELIKKFVEMKKEEEVAKSEHAVKLGELEIVKEKILKQVNMGAATLDQMIRDVGKDLVSARTGHVLSEKSIEKLLSRQRNIREELSKQRLEFRRVEKQLHDIQEKSNKLEDLGNGLQLIDFEQLIAETQNLSDKIEERDSELNKSRLRCEANTQQLAHIREKQSVLLTALDLKSTEYDELMQAQMNFRDDLNELKLQYKNLKEKEKNLTLKSGLLTKRALLKDYDEALEKLEHVQAENQYLKEVHEKKPMK